MVLRLWSCVCGPVVVVRASLVGADGTIKRWINLGRYLPRLYRWIKRDGTGWNEMT